MIESTAAHVLVGEDDPLLRRLIRVHLARDGHDVSEASDGRAVLEALATAVITRRRIDAIVMDVRMPAPDGLTILQRLAESASEVPVVLMTAFGNEELQREAARWGARALLDKPFTMEQLRQRIGIEINDGPLGERVRQASWTNDSVLVDRYVDVVNRAMLLRGQLRLAAPGGIRGPVALSVVEPGPGGTNVFQLDWRGWGFMRAHRMLATPTAARAATRDYLGRVIVEPWRYLAHPEELVLWR